MDKQPTLRTNVFSNPAVQGKLLLRFFAFALLLVATNWVMALRALISFGHAAAVLPASESVRNDILLLLAQQQTVLIAQLVIYSVLSLLLVALGSLLISHHIGGPLYHLASYCRGVVKGDVKPREIRFRKHDIPKDVAIAFNEFQRHHGIVPSDGEPGSSTSETDSRQPS
jgi:hypothetical protein